MFTNIFLNFNMELDTFFFLFTNNLKYLQRLVFIGPLSQTFKKLNEFLYKICGNIVCLIYYS